jgi:hypothetical protein
VSNIVSGGVQAGATVASGATSGMTQAAGGVSEDYGYFVDGLFRADDPATVSDDAVRGTVTRIFVHTLRNDGQLAAEDRTYLALLVAQRTNLSQPEAELRVDEALAKARKAMDDARLAAREAADTASKVAAWSTLWMFVALLCGAFFASFAATFGGRRRDAVVYLETETYVTSTSLPPVR